jgi:cbb3-type cytochrome oxidase subunit 3
MMETVVVAVVVWIVASIAFIPCWAWALRHRRREERALAAVNNPGRPSPSVGEWAPDSPRSTTTITTAGASRTDDPRDNRGESRQGGPSEVST